MNTFRRLGKGFLWFLLAMPCLSSSMPGTKAGDEGILLERIKQALPSGWRIAEVKSGEIPSGHYWGLKYEGPRGLEVVLEGTKAVAFHWKDKNGLEHQEVIAKEAIKLWLMPPDYSETWQRHFVPSGPKTAKVLSSGIDAKIYGQTSHRIVDVDRFNEILKTATLTGWPDSPSATELLSWETWRDDLRRAFPN